MQKLLFILAFIIVITGFEMKSSDKSSDKSLVGKWIAVENFQNPGNGGTWHALDLNDRFTIEFKSDKSFLHSSNFPKADSLFNHYSIDNSTLLLSSSLNNKKDTWYLFHENMVNDDELSLSIFLCSEPCPYRFKRIK